MFDRCTNGVVWSAKRHEDNPAAWFPVVALLARVPQEVLDRSEHVVIGIGAVSTMPAPDSSLKRTGFHHRTDTARHAGKSHRRWVPLSNQHQRPRCGQQGGAST